MDERLKSLTDRGADITVKLRRQNAFVLVRFEKETYKATGSTFEKALERVLDSINNRAKNIKAKRREKEHLRQDIMEQIAEGEEFDYVF
jgi:hypothetical protein